MTDKKIAYLINYLGDGGSEKYVQDLIHSMGNDRCILIYSEEGPGFTRFSDLGIPMYRVKMRNPFDISAAVKVKDIFSEENVGVVHAQFLRENYIGVLSKLLGAKVKLFWTYHVDVPMSGNVRRLNNFATRMNEAVISVSKYMKQSLIQKGVPAHKIKVIYNGIEDNDETRKAHLETTPVISIIGRLREEKGHLFLLQSLEALRKSYPDSPWICHMYGDGPQLEEIEGRIKQLQLEDRVIMKGFCSDKNEMFFKSDIIVIPSQNENLPYAGLEALSYHKPVVASNIGGIPEIIKHGETGYLVEYGDAEKFAFYLNKLLTDKNDYALLSNQGRDHFEKNFTLAKMVSDTKEIYGLK